MNKKIIVQIFGTKDKVLQSSCKCSSKKEGCSSDCGGKKSSCGGCGKGSSGGASSLNVSKGKTVQEAYEDLKRSISESDVSDSAELEFIDLKENNLEEEKYRKIKEIIDKGFEPPITVIDGIIRYYGGISNPYIYKDVKELLED